MLNIGNPRNLSKEEGYELHRSENRIILSSEEVLDAIMGYLIQTKRITLGTRYLLNCTFIDETNDMVVLLKEEEK